MAAQYSILEFTLVHWVTFRGHTGDEGNITPTLQLTVLNIKLLSRLTHTHTHKNCVSRGRLKSKVVLSYKYELNDQIV